MPKKKAILKSIFNIDDIVEIKNVEGLFTLIAIDYTATVLNNKILWVALDLDFRDNRCCIILTNEESLLLSKTKIDDINIKSSVRTL